MQGIKIDLLHRYKWSQIKSLSKKSYEEMFQHGVKRY